MAGDVREGARAALPDHGPLEPGTTFEKHDIVGLLGRGGSAFVYHGYHAFMDRHVAIKVIPVTPNKAAEFKRRARAEAMVLSRLRHPNVVRVYDAGVTDDGAYIYIVMELLEGRPLRDVLIALEALSVPEVLVIGEQVCDAVEMAHRMSVIHRDLKPENIHIETGNHARVLDFGVAKFLAGGAFQTTSKYRWHGTPLYMSPEHLQGRGVTVRSDVYALGIVLYEALAGSHPCLNGIETPTFQEIGWIQISNVPPLLTEVVPTIPDYVARVIQRAIAKAPENRYGSMHELGIALRDAGRRFTLESEKRRFAVALRDLVTETNARLGDRSAALQNLFPSSPSERGESEREAFTADTVESPLPPSGLRGVPAPDPTDPMAAPPFQPEPEPGTDPAPAVPPRTRDTVRLFQVPDLPARPRTPEASARSIAAVASGAEHPRSGDGPRTRSRPADEPLNLSRTPSPVRATSERAVKRVLGVVGPDRKRAAPAGPTGRIRAAATRMMSTNRGAALLAVLLGAILAVPIGVWFALGRGRRAAPAAPVSSATAALVASTGAAASAIPAADPPPMPQPAASNPKADAPALPSRPPAAAPPPIARRSAPSPAPSAPSVFHTGPIYGDEPAAPPPSKLEPPDPKPIHGGPVAEPKGTAKLPASGL